MRYDDYDEGSMEAEGVFDRREKELCSLSMGERLSAGFAIMEADGCVDTSWMDECDDKSYSNQRWTNIKKRCKKNETFEVSARI